MIRRNLGFDTTNECRKVYIRTNRKVKLRAAQALARLMMPMLHGNGNLLGC